MTDIIVEGIYRALAQHIMEPHVHDRVAITSADGFNGKQGVVDRISPTGSLPDDYTYWVDFGWKFYGRKVVPFQRREVAKVVNP